MMHDAAKVAPPAVALRLDQIANLERDLAGFVKDLQDVLERLDTAVAQLRASDSYNASLGNES